MATDAEGNRAEQAVTLDIIDSPSPSQPELIVESDSGDSNSNQLTNISTPTFRGTAEPGNTVELFAHGISLGSTTVDNSGTWVYSLPEAAALGDGSYAITAIALYEGTPARVQRAPIAVAGPGTTHQEFRQDGITAFAALKEDGSVVTWGYSDWGGNSSAVSGELQSGVTQIYSNWNAFAALKEDGSVITWGHSDNGGNSSAVSGDLQSDVTQVFSTGSAFAALKEDGSVVTWGSSYFGGDSSGVSGELQSRRHAGIFNWKCLCSPEGGRLRYYLGSLRLRRQ